MKLARQFMLVVFVILISVQPVFAATTDGMIESLNSNEVETYFCENQFNSIMEARNYSCFEIYKAKPEIFCLDPHGNTHDMERIKTIRSSISAMMRHLLGSGIIPYLLSNFGNMWNPLLPLLE